MKKQKIEVEIEDNYKKKKRANDIPEICKLCGGTGYVYVSRSGHPCPHCNGEGAIYSKIH